MLMIIKSRSILGRGPSFPFNKSSSNGLAYTEDINRINQSLFILFETPKGSRLMMPEFGSDVRKYRFDPLDDELLDHIRITMTADVKRWEPRIDLISVEFLADSLAIDNNILYVSISYRIINTQIVANYVYPYRLGTYDTLDISYN